MFDWFRSNSANSSNLRNLVQNREDVFVSYRLLVLFQTIAVMAMDMVELFKIWYGEEGLYPHFTSHLAKVAFRFSEKNPKAFKNILI